MVEKSVLWAPRSTRSCFSLVPVLSYPVRINTAGDKSFGQGSVPAKLSLLVEINELELELLLTVIPRDESNTPVLLGNGLDKTLPPIRAADGGTLNQYPPNIKGTPASLCVRGFEKG